MSLPGRERRRRRRRRQFHIFKSKKKRRIQYSAEKWKYHVVCHHKSLTFKDQKNFFFLSFFSSAAKEKRREEERTDGLDMGLNLLYCNTIAPREDV